VHRRNFLRASALLATVAGAVRLPAFAQGNAKPLTIYVPYPAGGTTDLVARAVSESIIEKTGQAVVVENRFGGGGQIAYSAMQQSAADASVMLMGDYATLGSNAHLYRKFSYDPLTQLQPLTPTVAFPMVLFVPKSLGINSVAELVALGKKKLLSYASQGNGAGGHLLGEMFGTAAGVNLNHVPYRGSAPAIQDTLAGQVDFLFDGVSAGLPYVRDGKLKALMVCAPKRAALLAGVPTSVELGMPDVQMTVWFAAATRQGTPAAVVQKMHSDIEQAFKTPRIAKRFEELGYETMLMRPEQFAAFMKEESNRWGAVIKKYHVSVE